MTVVAAVRTLESMLLRRLVLACAVVGVLAACGNSTPTAEVETTPSSTTTSTAAPLPTTYASLEPGNLPVDVGPGSVMTMLLNEMPDQDAVTSLGLRPLPTQLEQLPLLEGCPDVLPIARVERMAGQLSADQQIFEVLVQAGATMWPSPEAAQAAVDFYGTPEGVDCERREVEIGFDYSNQPGQPTLVSYEPSEVVAPVYDDIEGVQSFSKAVTTEQFDAPFVQTIETSVVVRGSVVWIFSISRMPGIDRPPAVVELGGEWLADRPALDVPAPDREADAAADRLLEALDQEVERPTWFEDVSLVELTTTRLDDLCSSFQTEPIAAANGAGSVAISQVAASSLSEQIATFATTAEATLEVEHYEATVLDCIRQETESLLPLGFTRNGETIERVSVDGVEVVVSTVDLIQTVGDQSFDVRIMTALGSHGTDAVHVSFEGLAGDEPDLGELVAGRLAILGEGG